MPAALRAIKKQPPRYNAQRLRNGSTTKSTSILPYSPAQTSNQRQRELLPFLFHEIYPFANPLL